MYQIKFQRQSVTSCLQSDGNGIDFYHENNDTPHTHTQTPHTPIKKIPATININVEHLDDIFFHLSVFSPFIFGLLFITRVAALQSYDRLYITTLPNVEYRSAKNPALLYMVLYQLLFIVTHMFSYCTCNNFKLNKMLFSLSI